MSPLAGERGSPSRGTSVVSCMAQFGVRFGQCANPCPSPPPTGQVHEACRPRGDQGSTGRDEVAADTASTVAVTTRNRCMAPGRPGGDATDLIQRQPILSQTLGTARELLHPVRDGSDRVRVARRHAELPARQLRQLPEQHLKALSGAHLSGEVAAVEDITSSSTGGTTSTLTAANSTGEHSTHWATPHLRRAFPRVKSDLSISSVSPTGQPISCIAVVSTHHFTRD